MRRALRAAIAIPIAAMTSYLLADNAQTPVFTLVGSIALMVAADFPGALPARALAYGGLGVNGAILIALGTWAAMRRAWWTQWLFCANTTFAVRYRSAKRWL